MNRGSNHHCDCCEQPCDCGAENRSKCVWCSMCDVVTIVSDNNDDEEEEVEFETVDRG